MNKYYKEHLPDPAAFDLLKQGIPGEILLFLQEHRMQISYDFYYNRFEIQTKSGFHFYNTDLKKLFDEVKKAFEEDESIF